LADEWSEFLLEVLPQLRPEDRSQGFMEGLTQGVANGLLELLGGSQGFQSLLRGQTSRLLHTSGQGLAELLGLRELLGKGGSYAV